MTTIKFRRGLSAEWDSKNPILAAGELGYAIDLGWYKIGDGLNGWLSRPYFVDVDAISELIETAIASLPGGGGGSDALIGNMLTLTTTDKITIVGAINEVNTPMVPLTMLYTNAKAG
jgi:hypothetical protein